MYKVDYSHPITVHFMGIGGISMSGLAEVLLGQGFTVTGSDRAPSPLTEHLEGLGARIYYPQAAENITDEVELVVYTAAISEDNPELVEAKRRELPLLTRAQLLGQIMDHYEKSIAVAGTHGKTTTSSMLGQILLYGDKKPTLSIGGIFPAIHSNILVGESDVFLTEACEYTNSYHSLKPRYGVILNIEEDHLDFFKDLDDIRRSFTTFAEGISESGLLAISGDIPDLDEITGSLDCRVTTFGLSGAYDVHPVDLFYDDKGCATFTPVIGGVSHGEIKLSVPGEHNVKNALAAIAIAEDLGISDDQIARGLEDFTGTVRRFEKKGVYKGAQIIDDYAHHPTEISATLSAAGALHISGKLRVVFQPHTYTRTKALLPEFAKALSVADEVIMADIYAAREKDIYGVSSRNVADAINSNGGNAIYLGTFDAIEDYLEKNLMNGDLLITMGAGNVNEVGEKLLGL